MWLQIAMNYKFSYGSKQNHKKTNFLWTGSQSHRGKAQTLQASLNLAVKLLNEKR